MPQYFGQLGTIEQPWLTLGAVENIKRNGTSIQIQCDYPRGSARGDRACLIITVLAANLIRVRLAPQGEFIPRRDWAVALDDSEFAIVPFDLVENDEVIEITTELVKVKVNKNPCQISCYDKCDRPFAQDITPMGWRKCFRCEVQIPKVRVGL